MNTSVRPNLAASASRIPRPSPANRRAITGGVFAGVRTLLPSGGALAVGAVGHARW